MAWENESPCTIDSSMLQSLRLELDRLNLFSSFLSPEQVIKKQEIENILSQLTSTVKTIKCTLKQELIITEMREDIWEYEYNFFCSFFWLKLEDYKSVILKIKEIYPWQAEGATIWPKILATLYTKYYFWKNIQDQDFINFKSQIENASKRFNPRLGFSWIALPLIQKLYKWEDVEKTLIKLRYLSFRERERSYQGTDVYLRTFKSWFTPNFRFSDVTPSWEKAIIDLRIDDNIPLTHNDFVSLNPTLPTFQNNTGIYIVKWKNGKFICLYYENNNLKLACYTSPWKQRSYEESEGWPWRDSPTDFLMWELNVSAYFLDKRRWPWHGGTWPMPSALATSVPHVYFHDDKANWGYLSHGCFHLDGFFANIFVRTVKAWTQWCFRPEYTLAPTIRKA